MKTLVERAQLLLLPPKVKSAISYICVYASSLFTPATFNHWPERLDARESARQAASKTGDITWQRD